MRIKISKSAILCGACATVLATIIINCSTTWTNNHRVHRELLDTINHLYVGCNKEWVDDKLGPATFIGSSENYIECIYTKDVAVVRAYYQKETETCDALFVTKYSKRLKDKIYVTYVGSGLVNNKPLGKFSFYDIVGEPLSVKGYRTNGDGWFYYSEEYYVGLGNYHKYYFMILDYGVYWWNRAANTFKRVSSEQIDDEVGPENIVSEYDLVATNRKKEYPNTYGIFAYNVTMEGFREIEEMLMNYRNYDLIQLKANVPR